MSVATFLVVFGRALVESQPWDSILRPTLLQPYSCSQPLQQTPDKRHQTPNTRLKHTFLQPYSCSESLHQTPDT